MAEILETLTRKTRELALGGIALNEALDRVLDEAVESEELLPTAEPKLRQQVASNFTGFGPLDIFLADAGIEEIWVNRPNEVFTADSAGTHRHEVDLSFESLQTIIERLLRHTGRRLDRSSPFVDASLADGSRLHVAIPDITRHWSVNIRKFPDRIITLEELVERRSLSSELAGMLAQRVRAGSNILVSGATQAGKTTLLCALLAALDPLERIVSVEETFEIRTGSKDWVALQARQSNLEGVGEVSLRRLVKEALRMRPSRLVVGEVREAEALDLLIALNSGLPGASTIHANSAAEAITKLCTLPLLAGPNISSDFVLPTVASCIDLVIHCEVSTKGVRRVSEVLEVKWQSSTRQIGLSRIFEVNE